jgi:ABC-type dipeptide transport system, periplasmic component
MVYGWAADWPDGYGFLAQITDSRSIRAAGNTNLGVKLPAVDKLLDQAVVETDAAKRDAIWPQIDRQVMEAAYYLPGVWSKTFLPAAEPDQRLRQQLLQHVRLPLPGREEVAQV